MSHRVQPNLESLPAETCAAQLSTPLARRGRGPARADFSMWRRETADASDGAIDAIATALHDVHLIAEPLWPAAVDGDPAAAVGIAIRALFGTSRAPTDLVMSCALVHASRGDPAAELVLSHARQLLV